MSYHKTLKSLKSGVIHPVYVLYGTEQYFIDTLKSQLEKIEDCDEIEYDLRETSLQEAIADAETFPFFSGKKLIVIHHPLFLQAKPEKTAVQHDLDPLQHYLDAPADHSILVFIAPYEKLDARKKITKQFKKTAEMVDCNPAKGQNFHAILKEMATSHGIMLQQETVEMMESEFHNNLSMLEKEVQKLATYVGDGDGSTVSKETASLVISPSNTFNALQFVDAVLKKDLAQAIKIFKELEKMSEEPIGLIALLAYQFRIIFQVKLMQEKGYSLDRMKSEIKVHPYVVQLARERSKYFSKQSLAAFIHHLTEADESIKRGQMEKGIAFEMLLYKLTVIS